ncbi:MAG: TRAP transporter large permease subunit [Pseudomonadota bacterium]
MISSEAIGILGLIVFFIILTAGVPIGIALGVVGFFGMAAVMGISPALGSLSSLPFHYSFEWVFVVLPMFLLLGHFSFHGGIGEDAYNAAQKWLGRVRGGLAMATTAACAAFGFASGSSLATAATFARLSLPEMRRHNYDVGLSCGAIAASGTLAALLPPSGMMVVYTIFTEVSLGKLLIAGILPGIMVAALFMIALAVWLKFKPEAAPLVELRVTLREKLLSIRWVGPLVFVIACLLGGIYAGIFTPTEAGATGAFVTFIIFLLRKGLNLKLIMETVISTISTTAMIFLIIIGAMIFGRFLAVSGLIGAFSEFMMGLPVHRLVILVIVLFMYLILGTFMEAVAIFALTLPIFNPLLSDLGFDGIWIGVMLIMMVEIGVITPPLGTNVYAVKATAGEDVTLEQIFAGVLPFFLAYVVAVAIVLAFPAIALWLPKMMW